MCNLCFFFFNDTATTEIYTLSLHDALPIYGAQTVAGAWMNRAGCRDAGAADIARALRVYVFALLVAGAAALASALALGTGWPVLFR